MTQLYESQAMEYQLDPKNIFNLVHLINTYCHDQTQNSRRDGQGDYGITWWQGDGKVLHIETERRGSGDLRVTLADLVLNDKELKIKIYAHTHLLANPQTLLDIAQQYPLR